MGGALRRIATNFNIENRAHRVLEQAKPKPAPKHPSTAKKIKTFQQENPQILEQQQQKDTKLLEMLRDVKVVSRDTPGKRLVEKDETTVDREKRPLPQNRRSNLGSQSVFLEADEIPEGRLSVGQAMELLAKHKRNKEEFTAEVLSKEYKLDLTDTKNILEYFQSFKVIPMLDQKDAPRLKDR